MKRLVLAALLAAGAAHAETRITTSPGPFAGWRTLSGSENGHPVSGTSRPGPFNGDRQTDITRDGHVTRCTTRPGPFNGQTSTTCH